MFLLQWKETEVLGGTERSFWKFRSVTKSFWNSRFFWRCTSRLDWCKRKARTVVCWGQVSRFSGLWRGRLRLLGRRCWPLELWFFSLGHPTLNVLALQSCTGNCRSSGGGKRHSTWGGAEIVGLLLLLFDLLLRLVPFETDVPGQAADCRNRLELVDDVPRDEVNVVVTELDTDVADAFPSQLVQLSIVHPLDTLHGEYTVVPCLNFLQCSTHPIYVCMTITVLTWDTGGS